eukprot:3441709-Rhodomonas_salina.1
MVEEDLGGLVAFTTTQGASRSVVIRKVALEKFIQVGPLSPYILCCIADPMVMQPMCKDSATTTKEP